MTEIAVKLVRINDTLKSIAAAETVRAITEMYRVGLMNKNDAVRKINDATYWCSDNGGKENV